MQPHRGLPPRFRIFHEGNYLFQSQNGAVMYLCVRFPARKKLRVHQGTGVDDHIRLLKKPRPPQRDQVFRAGTGAYKMNHTVLRSSSFLPSACVHMPRVLSSE